MTRELDLRGLKCPMPVLRTRRALSTLTAGSRLDVLCTDPLAAIDVPHLLGQTGDLLLARTNEAGVWRFSILKTASDDDGLSAAKRPPGFDHPPYGDPD